MTLIGGKTEKQWRAEADAQTLVSAEEVKSVPARLKAAKVAAKKIATDATKAAKTAKRVAGKPTSKRSR